MSDLATLSTGTALYYPYIHPRNADHIKSALLYWDRVRRIVPQSATHGHVVMGDDDSARLLVDQGLLIATRPEPYEAEAAKRFFDHVEPHGEKFRINAGEARELARKNNGIHIEKIGWTVLRRLEEAGLAHQIGAKVFMHQEVGAFYMFCLASEMGTKMRAPLFSDTHDDASLGQSLLFEPAPEADVSGVLARVGITLPSPIDLQEVPMARIAAFARSRAAERQLFRETVEDVVEVVRSARDQNAIDDYLSTQRVKISRAVKDFRDTLDELNVGAANSAARITVPTAIAAAMVAMPFSEIAAATLASAGLTIGVISCFAETRGKLRNAKIAAPYHYLTLLEGEFGIKAV